ncbi:MAG TPA: AAA family ATPase [Trebonia sp.]|jgi:exonuclease SbcC|nr:AAA family ATPase [Trebonia sp.]
MRPHRLRVQAFGAFAATEEVSFDDLEGLFLLHGETGAGKTTLLDAIAFALYGRVPGERGKTRRLRSDHAPAGVRTEVELEATIGGRRLRITRKPEQERPKKSGTGVTREQASVLLAELTPAGDWEVKSTRIGEADTEIADLMGMSAEQFFQVVLLPQGQFAQFLHADAEARARLLQKLFGTDRFRAVEDWLAERRRATAAAVTVAADRVNLLVAQVAQAGSIAVPETMDVPADAPDPWQAAWAADLAASAAAERDAAATVVAARKAELDAALAAKALAEQLADRQRRRRDTLRQQAELEAAAPAIARTRAAADAAARAAEVAPVLAEADRAAAAATAARHAEEQARAAIPDDSTTARDAGPGALRTAGQEQQSRLGMLDGLRADDSQAADEEENAAAALDSVAEFELALAAAQAAAAGHRAARPAAARARDDADQAVAALPAAQAAADTARRVAADAAALAAERADRDRVHEAHLGARERAVTRREEASAVREARIDGMRAELAATMTDGSPCPVCGSLDHPDPVEPTFQPVSREQEDAATVRAEAASAEADELGRHVAAADARIGDLAQRLADAGFPGSLAAADGALALLPAGPFSAEAAQAADPAALAAAVRQAAADAGRLETDAAALAAHAGTHPDRQRELEALDAAIAAGNARLAELTEKHAAAHAEAAGAAARAGEHRAKIRAQLGAAPDLDAAVRSTRLLAESLAAAADAADETSRAAAEAHEAAERAVKATAEAGFDAPDAAGAAFKDAAWRRDAADRVARHEAEAEAVAVLLADPALDVELDPPAPVTETTEAAGQAQREHDAANGAHGTACHTAVQLAGLKPQLEDALAALAPLRERAEEARQLADLAAGLGANQYRMTLSSFVLAARLEEVAKAASERLRTMTAGRFTLVHTDTRRGGGKAGLGLLACDAWTGVDRDTSTLSGGETFLASLALALGLADVVTAEAAGTPMEALFVDEGFGTLDEDTLDEVMNVLDGLRAGGRIVGIVSHVAELRQRIPAQVHVRKGHHGSHVTVTAG